MKEVKIGNQIWMAENLNVDEFRNGDTIPHAKSIEEWIKADKEQSPAWCYYDNDPVLGEKYGKLYNWYTVNVPQGLAPEGWRIPRNDDWSSVGHFLGDAYSVGVKMKSTSEWKQDGNGTNENGFSGLPGGLRRNYGLGGYIGYNFIGRFSFWWSSSEYNCNNAFYYFLNLKNGRLLCQTEQKGYGYSIRCLKDY